MSKITFTRRRFLESLGLCTALVSFPHLLQAAPQAAPIKPNFVFILADDLGLDGVSCYGADKYKTPNIDALAASGTRFQTAYASPLCGPTRALLMSGRYAFRTGGITNQSWRPGGPGAVAANEYPIARLLKENGYATGQSGKWRQVGETPGAWGFDQYLTDPTAGGWYWQKTVEKNGQQVQLPAGAYAPDVAHNFAIDFLRRNKEKPFFLYYAPHFVHGPILRTPDTKEAANKPADGPGSLYDDNLKYLDKQVGSVVAELDKLGIRKNTVIIFGGDNGTALTYPSTIGGRMINGKKGSMLEGGSRVPFIASWPGKTPAGKVSEDIVSYADPYTTFAELAGAKLPQNIALDGHSFAPQLRGEAGTPRPWAYVQLGGNWFVREPGFKLNQSGELFDMSDAPFTEKFVAVADDTPASQAARARLTAALAGLNPAAGKTDVGGGKKPRKAGRGEMFKTRDANGDGQLTKEEFSASLPDKTTAAERFANFDTNKDGVLNRAEFIAMGAK